MLNDEIKRLDWIYRDAERRGWRWGFLWGVLVGLAASGVFMTVLFWPR